MSLPENHQAGLDVSDLFDEVGVRFDGSQQDAHEFMGRMLDLLVPEHGNDPIVARFNEMRLCDLVRCKGCKFTKQSKSYAGRELCLFISSSSGQNLVLFRF